MMTTEEAQEYLSKMHESENAEADTQKAGNETGLQPEGDPADGGEGGSPNSRTDGGEAGKETTGTAGGTPSDEVADKASGASGGTPEGDGKAKTDLEKNKERWAKSFHKEKEKRKRLQANYENQIKALQKELAEAKQKIGSEGFDRNSDEGIQAIVDQKSAERELARLEEQQAELEMAEDLEENERRINACFPDEADRQIYRQLVENGGRKFADKLAMYDKDNVILSGLDDCEISPIVIRVLMTKPQFLDEILSKRNRHARELAFDSLVNRLKVADKVIRERRANKENGNTEKTEKVKTGLQNLKATGKQAKTSSAKDTEVVKDANYWNKYLEEHSR